MKIKVHSQIQALVKSTEVLSPFQISDIGLWQNAKAVFSSA